MDFNGENYMFWKRFTEGFNRKLFSLVEKVEKYFLMGGFCFIDVFCLSFLSFLLT